MKEGSGLGLSGGKGEGEKRDEEKAPRTGESSRVTDKRREWRWWQGMMGGDKAESERGGGWRDEAMERSGSGVRRLTK